MQDYTQTEIHFKIISDIGGDEGKNSTVHIAHDNQLDAEIVVKKIKKSDFKDSSSFFDEAKKLYSASHPNIAPIQYSCQDEEFIYITMPLFPKGSLSKLINERPLTVSEIIKYSIDLLSGLHYIHTNKLVHCDIKPTNILLSNSNDAILTDFGLAKHLNDEGYTIVDKFYHFHRAPETLQTNVITHQSDIFQAGLTVYRLCNGNSFFKSQLNKYINQDNSFNNDKFSKAIFDGKFPDRTGYLLHIPQKLKNYIRKALEVNPEDRYNSVLDFLNDLASIEVHYDWQFLPQDGINMWQCYKGDKVYEVTVSATSDTEATVSSTKRVLTGAKKRQILDYSNKKVTFEDAYKLAKKALNNNSL